MILDIILEKDKQHNFMYSYNTPPSTKFSLDAENYLKEIIKNKTSILV